MATKGVNPFAGKDSKKSGSKEKQMPPWMDKKKAYAGGGMVTRGNGAAVRGTKHNGKC